MPSPPLPEAIEKALQELHRDDPERGPCSSMLKVRRAIAAEFKIQRALQHQDDCERSHAPSALSGRPYCRVLDNLRAQAAALEAGEK